MNSRIAVVSLLVSLLVSLAFAGRSDARQEACQADLNGDGIVDGTDLALLLGLWGETCGASVQSISPSFGSSGGGQVVTITGTRLAGASEVSFGGAAAARITVMSPTEITCVTPPGTPGDCDVSVTTPAGTVVLAAGFRYHLPVPWATVLEPMPDPAVVVDAKLRAAIIATNLPWRVVADSCGMEMLLVPPGEFAMGCSPSWQFACRIDEEPVHQVTLTQPYYLGRHEVTQTEWTGTMGWNPSSFQGLPDSPMRPVDSVSFGDAAEFLGRAGLRLPTEAEWERACRAGTTTAFNIPPHGSDDDAVYPLIGWYSADSGGETHPVGQKLANALGFHDMVGNVQEYCQDWWSLTYYSVSPAVDPTGPATGVTRVQRGGGYGDSFTDGGRSSSRSGYTFGDPVQKQFGVRAARTP